MKLSVSLPDDDIEFIDDYASRVGGSSRSSVLHRAIELLRTADMEDAYRAAFEEWDGSEDAVLWETTVPDGITDATR